MQAAGDRKERTWTDFRSIAYNMTREVFCTGQLVHRINQGFKLIDARWSACVKKD